MHEYSIVSALMRQVETAASENGATAVHHIRVKIGELAGVEPELFATAFELCRERTVCSAAHLEIVPAAAEWRCPACAVAIAEGGILRCVRCELPAQLAGGDEIILERIEMEVPEIRADDKAADLMPEPEMPEPELPGPELPEREQPGRATAAETMEVHRV